MTLPPGKKILVSLGCLAIAFGGYATAAPPGAGHFQAVLADPIRPPEDVVRDAERKPTELLSFAGVHDGMTIAELAPGGGYFTRILTGAVGSKGHVYAITGHPSPALQALAQKRSNLTVVAGEPGTIPVQGEWRWLVTAHSMLATAARCSDGWRRSGSTSWSSAAE